MGVKRSGGKRLTGAGPRSQRGLESPGAEVGRCSLKDEGDRQGDKHGPLSTWGSSFVVLVSLFFFSYPASFRRSLAFLRLRFQVCGQPCVQKLGRLVKKKRRLWLFSSVDAADSHLLVFQIFVALGYRRLLRSP